MLEIIKSTEEVILPYEVIDNIFSQIENKIFVKKSQRKDILKEEKILNGKTFRLSSINIMNKGNNNKNIFKDKLKKLLYNNQKSRTVMSILNN